MCEPLGGASKNEKEITMTKQAQTLEAWFALWGAVSHMLEIELEPTSESQELIDALSAMAED